MKTGCILIAFVATVYGASLPDKIVGGSDADIAQYPNAVQVDLLTSGVWDQVCAGVILTSRWILSAAHCFEASSFTTSNRRIRAGATTRNTGGTVINIESRINHPSYGVISFMDADIALARLASALTYSASIQPGSIPGQGLVVPDNAAVIVAGWGRLWSGGPFASQLQHVTIYTVNRSICNARYITYTGWRITDNMICAGLWDVGGQDACNNDSGGPLYFAGIVVGIVSWGIGCADSFFPGVNTRVSSYTEWIVSNAV